MGIQSAGGHSELISPDVWTTPVEHVPLAAVDVLGGEPTSGTTPLLMRGGVEVGVWEVTPGIATAVEFDELFVVLSGRGQLEIEGGASIPLTPGTTVRLEAGDRTTWIVDETLRKVYVVLPPEPDMEVMP